MSHPINLESLRVIRTINEKGSFAAAAQALYKVPSALTYTVNKLEQDLGVTLFDRSGHRAVLTEAGELILREGQQLLDAANRLSEKVKELETGWEPRLTIAIDTLLAMQPVMDLIHEFCLQQKPVNIQLIEEVLGGGWDALHSNRADIAIGVNGETIGGSYDINPIGEAELVFAVAADHPLAAEPEPISAKRVGEFPAIVVKDSSQSLPARSSGLFDARQTIHVSAMRFKIDAQLRGVGVGFLPLHSIKPKLDSGELKIKYTDIPRPSIPLYVAKSKNTQGKAAQWFYERISQINWLNYSAAD